jgi:hypothetical protein
VIAGTATAVSNRVSRRQAGRWADQEPQANAQPVDAQPAAAPQTDMGDQIEQLKQLAELRDQGVLSDQEFEAQKRKILGS